MPEHMRTFLLNCFSLRKMPFNNLVNVTSIQFFSSGRQQQKRRFEIVERFLFFTLIISNFNCHISINRKNSFFVSFSKNLQLHFMEVNSRGFKIDELT